MPAPGDTVTLDVWHDGARHAVAVALADAAEQSAAAENLGHASAGAADTLGMALRPLAPDEQREAGAHGGLVIENVSGPAVIAGLRAGDLLLGINGKPVDSIVAVRAVLAGAAARLLAVQRGQDKLYVSLSHG